MKPEQAEQASWRGSRPDCTELDRLAMPGQRACRRVSNKTCTRSFRCGGWNGGTRRTESRAPIGCSRYPDPQNLARGPSGRDTRRGPPSEWNGPINAGKADIFSSKITLLTHGAPCVSMELKFLQKTSWAERAERAREFANGAERAGSRQVPRAAVMFSPRQVDTYYFRDYFYDYSM